MPSVTGSLTDSGDSSALVDLTAAQWIEVWSLSIMGKDSDVTVTLKTGTTERYTVLCPATGVGGISVPSGSEPVFQGLVGEDLIINLSGAGDVAYNVNYRIGGAV